MTKSLSNLSKAIFLVLIVLHTGCHPFGPRLSEAQINQAIANFIEAVEQRCQECSATKITVHFGGFIPCPDPCPGGQFSKDDYFLSFISLDGASSGRSGYPGSSSSFVIGGSSNNCSQIFSLLSGTEIEIWQPSRWICFSSGDSYPVYNECKYKFNVPPRACNSFSEYNVPAQRCKCK